MAYVEGKDLYDYVQEKGRLTQDEALDLIIPIVQAVAYAHEQGVIHRDIKPQNIMLDKTGDTPLDGFCPYLSPPPLQYHNH